MNQILQVKENKNKGKLRNVKEIVLFLVIVIIIFGLIFGAYTIYKNIINGSIKLPWGTETPKNTPIITLTQTEDEDLAINVESPIGISSITYNWNNEEPQTMEVEGKNNIEKIIDIPIGENTIFISVIDINGEETQKQENFVAEVPKPVIELSVVGNDIKITVTSEIELSEVTYKWNSEDEKTQNMQTYKNRTKFEKKLEIPLGKNTLKIVAVDVNGSQTEKSQEIKGVTKATTTTTTIGEYLHFTVVGSENIKTVEFEFNGQKYLMNQDTFGKTKNVHYKVKLVEGTNYLKITSTTQSDGVDTTEWNYEYTTE